MLLFGTRGWGLEGAGKGIEKRNEMETSFTYSVGTN